MKIRAQQYSSKTNSNKNSNLTISLRGSEKLLPLDTSFKTINELELYNTERFNCESIRLTCIINPICSNVIYNNITEIILNEGSNNCKSLNYNKIGNEHIINPKCLVTPNDLSHVQYKSFSWFFNQDGAANAIRDTQLSNTDNGFTYHCGLNIFNNHILRSKTFKTVCKLSKTNNDNFNTISDYMRNIDGTQIRGYSDYMVGTNMPNINLHLYLGQDILSFKDCVSQKLVDENGWIGFYNAGKFSTYDVDNHDKPLDIYQTINNQKSCTFIDLSPERDLYYFTPKYNKFKQRIEKNWNYCITYPSSSTTDVSFIRKGTNSLMSCAIDDTTTINGNNSIIIYSVSKHGLSENSIVNIYVGDNLYIRNTTVAKIIDDFTFAIYSGDTKMPSKWRDITISELQNKKFIADINGKSTTFTISSDLSFCFYLDKFKVIKLPIFSKPYKVNLDLSSLDTSYKEVIEGNELEYYVRIFSRLPNWKNCDNLPTINSIYENNSQLLHNYQTIENEFENHIGKLAFAKNIYGDDISEIVFTDNIDISLLKDNLGRPLTTVYLSIFKNNQGYKEWYGKNGTIIDLNSDNVEYSHVFGKLNCAFHLSPKSTYNYSYNNIVKINNIDSNILHEFNGLNINDIQSVKRDKSLKIDNDEIQYSEIHDNSNKLIYSGDTNFYGDLCCYSTVLLDEKVIQPIEYRFNTAQRELTKNADTSANSFFNNFVYDEIERDDYDYTKEYANPSESDQNFIVKEYKIMGACQRREGYRYTPHYEIPIHSFSDTITTSKPIYAKIYNVDVIDDNIGIFNLNVTNIPNVHPNDNIMLKYFNTITKSNMYVVCSVEQLLTANYYKIKFMYVLNNNMQINEFITLLQQQHENTELSVIIKQYCKIFTHDDSVPNYAVLSTDGSGIYMWRNVIPNGFNKNGTIEDYPFTNGAFYVNKQINLFVQRQDPNGIGKLASTTYPLDFAPKTHDTINENNFYLEQDIKC